VPLHRLRIFSLPAGLLGVALAILFFVVYGRLTRPVVARPVQRVIAEFAHGVEIGRTVESLRAEIPGTLQFVPQLGYIANVRAPAQGWPPESQLWLLLNEKDRATRDPGSARVDAVEVLSSAPLAFETFSGNAGSIFGKSPARGCLVMDRPGSFRHVLHWAAANDRGGIVVMVDDVEDAGPVTSGATVATLLAYAGKFDSSRTLRGRFTPSPCKLVVLRDRGGHAANAAEHALAAFADSIAGSSRAQPAPRSELAQSRLRSRAGAVRYACADPGWNPEGWHEARAGHLRIVLPPGFPEASVGGSKGPSYRWTQRDGGADLQLYPVRSEKDIRIDARVASSCTTQRPQGAVTVRVGERRDAPGALFVSAYFIIGRTPAFAIVATTTDTALRTMLLHTIRTAIESPVWSLRAR